MIGIFGFGRFGELMARYLAEDFPVAVRDTGGNSQGIEALGARAADLETTAAQDILILSVPISAITDTLEMILPYLKPGALVLDVSSVKVLPDKWLGEMLPSSISYLPTHPMFGPDSAADSLKGRKIVLCPGRVTPEQYVCIKSYLEKKGLDVIETTPEAHDREIAVSLALTHFIGRSLSGFGAEELQIDTEGYKRLLHILDVVENDTWQLFFDMNYYNPYAGEVRDSFLYAMEEIKNRLES
ncbi:Prephenate and/or arogenate dehydrogenase (unknown specificity) (EC (EC [Olavius algarvensis associated proteobacterium Delta 3]|nr:Prephenate and/or arogenate dehydrogenase (unknown specificity) (EC (EC [Olavius algarvensis associated proteobacterium Delta 3]CAB5155610.1 Prephenate and/or arogenate dehydrogenase (unknown specificity) (EC (EC [Olavius algarvensis associated proteobacterium Delta 3]